MDASDQNQIVGALGASGCFLSQPDSFTQLPAFKVNAVDTTGAGDAFVDIHRATC